MQHLTAELAYWITERYAIKERKEKGVAKPWSMDPIFQTVRFCNVHREDDAVTVWIRKNWNRPSDPAWRFVLGRMLNLSESLEALGISPFSDMKTILKERRESGVKIFTSAYTISTCGKSMDKIDYVFDWVCERVKDAEPRFANVDTCTWMFGELINIDGLGSFLAGQVIADMKNTKGHRLASAPDFWTFSVPGPGSLRGLSWYFYQQPEGVTTTGYDSHLKKCRYEVDPLIPAYIPRIGDQDFQNCLCEFSKYMKVKRLGGHVRNIYPGV